jgi:hypothetical protein
MLDKTMNRISLTLCLFLCLKLVGCASDPSQTDRQFGLASRDIFNRQQSIADTASLAPSVRTSDGGAMKSAIDRYQKSFETLPVPVNIFNIGVGTPMVGTPQR